ncbi:18875_t:CDS:2 [Entrophospora sp. SA101]|nr:18875_t:CDS:2 [Entrophospora sp. SA101]
MSLDISPMRRLSSMSNGPEILDTFTNTLLPPPKEFTTTSSNVFHSQPSTFKPFNQITSVSYALEQLSNTVLKNSISHKNDDDIINWLEGCDVNVEGMNSGMGGNDILETKKWNKDVIKNEQDPMKIFGNPFIDTNGRNNYKERIDEIYGSVKFNPSKALLAQQDLDHTMKKLDNDIFFQDQEQINNYQQLLLNIEKEYDYLLIKFNAYVRNHDLMKEDYSTLIERINKMSIKFFNSNVSKNNNDNNNNSTNLSAINVASNNKNEDFVVLLNVFDRFEKNMESKKIELESIESINKTNKELKYLISLKDSMIKLLINNKELSAELHNLQIGNEKLLTQKSESTDHECSDYYDDDSEYYVNDYGFNNSKHDSNVIFVDEGIDDELRMPKDLFIRMNIFLDDVGDLQKKLGDERLAGERTKQDLQTKIQEKDEFLNITQGKYGNEILKGLCNR